MIAFLLRRVGVMIVTALCLTFIVFYLTNLEPNLEKLAKFQGNQRMSDAEVASWLDKNGYMRPTAEKYAQWLGLIPAFVPEGGASPCPDGARYCGILQGHWGYSTVAKEPVSGVLMRRLSATGTLLMWVMIVMVPISLVLGILSGMREGSRLDRGISATAILTTATPEYVSGVVLVALFASSKFGLSPILHDWGWIEGKTLFKATAKSALKETTFENFFLPVATITLYGMGYITRMTRASMAEVMQAQYIRTARLKGASFARIVIKHALRNALITPFTVIMLQIPWLLTGVVIVETLFAYNGFGMTLVSAAESNDIDMLLAVSVISVAAVLMTQLISDIGYTYLNPRLRVT